MFMKLLHRETSFLYLSNEEHNKDILEAGKQKINITFYLHILYLRILYLHILIRFLKGITDITLVSSRQHVNARINSSQNENKRSNRILKS